LTVGYLVIENTPDSIITVGTPAKIIESKN